MSWFTRDLKCLGVNICCIQESYLIPSKYKGGLRFCFSAYSDRCLKDFLLSKSFFGCSLFTCLKRSDEQIVHAGCYHKEESVPTYWVLCSQWTWEAFFWWINQFVMLSKWIVLAGDWNTVLHLNLLPDLVKLINSKMKIWSEYSRLGQIGVAQCSLLARLIGC